MAKITLTFGLVTIPCKRSAVTTDRRIKAKRVCPDHMAPIKLQSVCTCEDHVVEDTVPAYEAGDALVIVPRETMQVEDDKVLELTAFVDGFDGAFFEKSEILAPDTGGENAFSILAQALRERGGMAVGSMVANKARRRVGVRWSEALDCVTIHVLALDRDIRWADAEKASPQDADDAKQVALAVTLLESLDDVASLDAVDEYDERVRAYVAEHTVAVDDKLGVIPDLMEGLRASVAQKEKAK